MLRHGLIWAAFVAAVVLPLVVAGTSPLLAWRDPIYIAACFAGIISFLLLLTQPLLAGGFFPGLNALRWRRVHRWVGFCLVLSVVVHVLGLWITSPPDIVDALLFVSPTPFAIWGVIAMWAVFAAAGLAIARRRLSLRPAIWRRNHLVLVAVIVATTIPHVLMIEGLMSPFSKWILCGFVVAATAKILAAIYSQRDTQAKVRG